MSKLNVFVFFCVVLFLPTYIFLKPQKIQSNVVVVDGRCHWGNVWHFMVQCVLPFAQFRLKNPEKFIEIDLTIFNEDYKKYYGEPPHPENIYSNAFLDKVKLLHAVLDPIKFVSHPNFILNQKFTELDRPLNFNIQEQHTWQWIQNKILSKFNITDSNEKFCTYISRKYAKMRVLSNEHHLQSVLKEFCRSKNLTFRLIHLEQLSIEKQILEFVSSKILIFERGAAMANVIFLQTGSTVIYIDGPDDSSWMIPRTHLFSLKRIMAIPDYFNFAPTLKINVNTIKIELLKLKTTFKIIVLTQRRFTSLVRLLKTINDAIYFKNDIELEIHIDYHKSYGHTKIVELAKKFLFIHGTKSIKIYPSKLGLVQMWLQAWSPISDTERAVILEDDMELSPFWLDWLARSWQTYGNRTDLAGISLCRQRQRASDGKSILFEYHEPFLYRLVGSFGFSPNARLWRPFVQWALSMKDLKKRDVFIPGIISSLHHRQNPTSWEQYWIWWCWHGTNAFYNLYIHPKAGTLITHWAEPGEHSSSQGHQSDTLLQTDVSVLHSMPLHLARFNWSFQLEN